MQCNIDGKGRVARGVSGVLTALAGVVLGVLGWMEVIGGAWVWIVAGAALVGGGFQMYEARAGWCVVRAMGFKTPM